MSLYFRLANLGIVRLQSETFPMSATTPSRLLAGSREDTRLAQMYGRGTGSGNFEKKVEVCGVVHLTKTYYPALSGNLQRSRTSLSYTFSVCVARSAMNNIYGVISATESQAVQAA